MKAKGKSPADQALPSRRSVITSGGAVIGALLMTSAVAQTNTPEGTVDVKKFGASGIRADNATKAFRDAVGACMARGGGAVNVPPGEYTVGTIQLMDNITLHIEAGATLYLSQDRADFMPESRSMIFASNAKNISLTGRGKIDGLAQYDYTEMRDQDPEIAKEREIARAAGIDMRRYYRKREAMNTFLVVFNDCSHVLIRDISLVNSPLWTVRLNDCDRVEIRGVYLFSDLEKGVNADGIDICSSRNVTISDSVITTADDAIVLKSISRGGRKANPVENVTVTNCVLTSSSTPLMIGTETEADIRHVVFSNCVIRNSNKGFGINVQDGATVSDIIFSHLTIETNRRHWNWWGDAELFKFILRKRTPSSRLGQIRDVFIDHIIAHPRGTATMMGSPEQPLENIWISDVRVMMTPEDARDKRATHAMTVDGVKGLRVSNLSIEWDAGQPEPAWRSAITLKNVSDFVIDSFSGRQGLQTSGEPVILMEDVSQGILRNSQSTAGSGTFVHVRGKSTNGILLLSNRVAKGVKEITFENKVLERAVEVRP